MHEKSPTKCVSLEAPCSAISAVLFIVGEEFNKSLSFFLSMCLQATSWLSDQSVLTVHIPQTRWGAVWLRQACFWLVLLVLVISPVFQSCQICKFCKLTSLQVVNSLAKVIPFKDFAFRDIMTAL